jgi:hypothetical protein
MRLDLLGWKEGCLSDPFPAGQLLGPPPIVKSQSKGGVIGSGRSKCQARNCKLQRPKFGLKSSAARETGDWHFNEDRPITLHRVQYATDADRGKGCMTADRGKGWRGKGCMIAEKLVDG